MISKRMLFNIRQRHGSELYDFLNKNNNYRGAIKIQSALKSYNNKLVIDGRVGPRTLSLLVKCYKQDKFKAEFAKDPDISMEDYIMNYLAIEEGTSIHFNSTEKTFTTPYGVYAYYHRHSKVVKYVKQTADENGFHVITKRNVKRVDMSFTRQDKEIIRDLAYKFYMEDYLDMRLFKEMVKLGYVKSLLSTLSLSVNAHPKTGNILLQRALGVKTDGVIGPITLSHIRKHTDEQLNRSFLVYAKRFYLGLNTKRYINGYLNRVKNLK